MLPLESHMDTEDCAARELLERAAAIGERYGVRVTPRIVHARDAGEAVVAEAEERRPELIVIAAPRRKGTFAPAIIHVLQNAQCRVMVVGAAAA